MPGRFARLAPVAALLAASLAAPARAACPDPAPPARLAQQETAVTPAGPVLVRAVEAPDQPRLELLGAACQTLLATGFGTSDPDAKGASAPMGLLRFRLLAVPGRPAPTILAMLASPGGSDTEFQTQILAVDGAGYRPLLPHPVETLIEGGVFLGELGHGLGPGFAAWSMQWGPGDIHAGPHRYALRRWRWTAAGLSALPARITRTRFATPQRALAALGAFYPDMTTGFPAFRGLR